MKRCKLTRCTLLAAFLFYPAIAAAQDPSQSDLLRLSQHPAWHQLIQYVSSTAPDVESEIDGASFFLSPRGKTRPQDELAATLSAIRQIPTSQTTSDDHAQCRFPARTRWLKSQLPQLAAHLPDVSCSQLQTWKQTLNAKRVTLIFSSYYVNNPASMYGHTFLRLDPELTQHQAPLLSYSVNFAANTGSDGGIAFAVLGLTGGYPGTFSTIPYYLKVKQYSHFESRDLWEYALTLSPEEIDFMVDHLWELGHTHFDYFFLNENCSYHLLSLLDVLRADRPLKADLPWWVIPIDTVKAVLKDPTSVGDITYRPSLLAQARAELSTLSPVQRKQLARGLKREERFTDPRLADAALTYLAYKHKGPQRTAYQKSLAIHRSQIPEPKLEVQVPTPPPPHAAHESFRSALGGGARRGEGFVSLSLRPALHDLLADDTGLPPFSEIRFGDLALRAYPTQSRVALQELTLIGIRSISPYEPFFQKASWNVNFGARNPLSKLCLDCSSAYLEGGPGIALPLGHKSLVAYGFANAAFDAAPWNPLGYRLGLKSTMGLLLKRQGMGLHAFGSAQGSVSGGQRHFWEAGVESRLSPQKNLEYRLGFLASPQAQELSGHMAVYF